MINPNLVNQNSHPKLLKQWTVSDNEIDYSTLLPRKPLFGTDGIRGLVGKKGLLNSTLAFNIGICTGKVLQRLNPEHTPVILGQDSRNSSDMLATALTKGLVAVGVEVWHLGLCPTPAVAHVTSVSRAMGGIMISASHNPPEDNGIKFFGADGSKLSTLVQKQIEAEIRQGWGKSEIKFTDSVAEEKQLYRGELIAEYLESIQKPFRSNTNLAGLKIVLDLAWGAMVNIAPEVFKSMGAEVISLHPRADGDRINVNCGSTNVAALQAAIQLHQADMGFAFDGDGDRVIAVDSQGQVVDGDYILYFWGQALCKKQLLPHNTIVTTVMSNLGFENAWKSFGGKLIRTTVGDRHVHAKMVELGAMLGGEQSGHILCPHYGISGDGVLTALHLAALVKESGTSLQKMLARSFKTYPQLLKNVKVEDSERRLNWQDCQPLQKAIAKAEKAMGNQGRVLVRSSGTEPVIRVMVEAINNKLARHWTNNLVFCVEKNLAK